MAALFYDAAYLIPCSLTAVMLFFLYRPHGPVPGVVSVLIASAVCSVFWILLRRARARIRVVVFGIAQIVHKLSALPYSHKVARAPHFIIVFGNLKPVGVFAHMYGLMDTPTLMPRSWSFLQNTAGSGNLDRSKRKPRGSLGATQR